MVKIHITGNSGSGKTTFAENLGQALHLPVFGMDRIVWQPGWRKTEKSQLQAEMKTLVEKPFWIIEGVSRQARAAADIIVFLDVSRVTSLRRSYKRNMRYLFSSRPGLPANCPEILLVRRQLEIIWQFKGQARPVIIRDLQNHHGLTYIADENTDFRELQEKIVTSLKNCAFLSEKRAKA